MLKKVKREDVINAVNITFDGITKQLESENTEYALSLNNKFTYDFKGGKKWWTLQWWKIIKRPLTRDEKMEEIHKMFPVSFFRVELNNVVFAKLEHNTTLLKRDIHRVWNTALKLKNNVESLDDEYVYLDTVYADFVDNSKEFITGSGVIPNG